jgi:hypothetical protein
MLDTDTITQLLLQDAIPTLGDRARDEVLRLSDNYQELALEWIENGDSIAEAQLSVERSIVEGLQQTAHDAFWDTTWPACPRHRRHPLWYDEKRRAWCCHQDAAVIAPLGGLTGPGSPAT